MTDERFVAKFEEWSKHFGWTSHEELERAKRVWTVVYSDGRNSRDAEIADLQRQLQERDALETRQIEERVRDGVQEKVEAAIASERKIWQSRESDEYRQALLKRAVEAEKRADKAEAGVDRAVLAEARYWLGQMEKRGHRFDLWGEEADRISELERTANRAKVPPSL